MHLKNFALVFLLVFGACTCRGATILERTVSVKLSNTAIKDALDVLADQAHFEWSYNASILDNDKRISLIAREISVREALIRILGQEYEFRENGNYLILKKPKKPQKTLSGYISDSKTGQRVPNATVYDRKTLKSATTDASGFYQLPVKSSAEVVVSRLGYKDTILYVTSQAQPFQKIALNTEAISMAITQETSNAAPSTLTQLSQRTLDKFTRHYQRINSLNVRDSLSRSAQVSLLPWVGTNLSMSGAVRNNWSLNVLVGYSGGSRIIEVGGIGNISKGKTTGIQIGGAFNVVNGEVQGTQIAGVLNQCKFAAYGMQFSGFANISAQNRHQLLQAASVFNYFDKGTTQIQAAGLFNWADSIQGLQASGFINHANSVDGLQASGFSNSSRTVNGIQAAAFQNRGGKVNGLQISSVFNRAKTLHGLQIGLFNKADTIKGLQIGLINRSRSGGYNAIDLSANETTPYNFSLKTGVPAFYVILTGGFSDQRHKKLICAGLGIGSRMGRRVAFNPDLIWRHTQLKHQPVAVQEWIQLSLALDVRLFKRLYLALGPTANLLVSDATNSYFLENRTLMRPERRFIEERYGTLELAAWWGAQGGLKFRF